MYQYVRNVGTGYSSESSNWGDFGSLLSGTFGLLASFSAVATLLVVLAQFKKQNTLIEKQLESIEFERYDKHRRIFFEKLESIERIHHQTIRFKNKEELYQLLFPFNSPERCLTRIVEQTIPIMKGKGFPNLRMTMISISTIIDVKQDGLSKKELLLILDAGELLQLESLAEKRFGDISYKNSKTIFNAYDLKTGLEILEHTYITVLSYGNMKTQPCICNKIKQPQLLKGMINAIHDGRGDNLLEIKVERETIISTVYEKLGNILHKLIKLGKATDDIFQLSMIIDSVFTDVIAKAHYVDDPTGLTEIIEMIDEVLKEDVLLEAELKKIRLYKKILTDRRNRLES